jgi:hypothetical protein
MVTKNKFDLNSIGDFIYGESLENSFNSIKRRFVLKKTDIADQIPYSFKGFLC